MENLYNIFKIYDFNSVNISLLYHKLCQNYFNNTKDREYWKDNFIDILNRIEIEKDISHMRYILKFNNEENNIFYFNNKIAFLFNVNYILFTFYNFYFINDNIFDIMNQRKDFTYKLLDFFIKDSDNTPNSFFMSMFLNYTLYYASDSFSIFCVYEFLNYFKDLSEEISENFINRARYIPTYFHKIILEVSEYFKDYSNVVKLAFKFIID